MAKKTEGVLKSKRVKPDGLAANDKKRTADVQKKLESAMVKIRAEIELSEMIYPRNKGRLTQAEVCRRAGIRNVVLRGTQHITTTKVTVDEFVTEMQGLLIGTGKSAKRIITSRADDWKERHEKIAQAYHIDHLRLEAALKQVRRLEAENAKLRAQLDNLSNSNIRNFPKTKRNSE